MLAEAPAAATPSADLGVRPFLFAPLPLRPCAAEAESHPAKGKEAGVAETAGLVGGGDADAEAPVAADEAPPPVVDGSPAPAAGAPAPDSALVVLSEGSVVNFSGDVIVNAANTGCLMGGAVDGAIVDAGGEELMEARQALPVLDHRRTRCRTGDAKRTIGGQLPAKWCVHAVGPNYAVMAGMGKSLEDGDKLLRSAYLEAMARSREVAAETIGFSLLSAGVFRGRRTLAEVLDIAIDAVEEGAYPGLREVHMVAYTEEEREELGGAARRTWARRGVGVDA